MSNVYGVAHFAKQNAVPQVEWKNIDIIGQYIDNLNKQKQLEMMDKSYELAKDQNALYKEKFLEDVRQFELKRNTLSAKEQADMKLREQEMANAIRTAQIGASAGIAQANATNAMLKYNMDEAARARLESDTFYKYKDFIRKKDNEYRAMKVDSTGNWNLLKNPLSSTIMLDELASHFGDEYNAILASKALELHKAEYSNTGTGRNFE